MFSLPPLLRLGLVPVVLAGCLTAASAASAAVAEFGARKPPDTRAPRLVEASALGRRLVLTFDEQLRAATIHPTALRVDLNGRRIGLRSARARNRQVELVLTEQAFGDDVVSVSFLRDSGGTVPRDLAGNEARAFRRTARTSRALPGCSATLERGTANGDYSLSEATHYQPGVFAPALGAVRAIALFVDFPDAPANESIAAVSAHVLDPVPHWYAAASYGRMQLRIDRLDRWLRMPLTSAEYKITRDQPGPTRDLVAAAIAGADADLDFRPYRLVYVVAPRDSGVTYSPAYVYAPGSGVRADGNELSHGAIFGRDARAAYGSRIAIHETGHALGLPDLYSYTYVAGRNDQAVGNYDVMGELQTGAGFLAWHRWKLRWLDAGQLRCYRGGTREIDLTPLDSPGGVKAIAIPIDTSRAWVLELRRRQGIDTGLCQEGVVAYLVDATIASGAGPVKIRPAGTGTDRAQTERCGPLYDAPYVIAEGRRTFTEAAFTAELIAPTADGYRVRIAPRG